MATTAEPSPSAKMKSPIYIPANSPDWHIGVTSFFALLADPGDDATEKRWSTVDALASWFAREWARRFGTDRVDPELLKMPKQQMYNKIDRSWRRVGDRLIAAELALRVLLRIARRTVSPSGLVLADHLAGGDGDIEKLHLLFGPGAERAAGSSPRATITSVIQDHARSIVRVRGRHRDAPSVDDLNFGIHSEMSNIFARIWTPSKPVLHLAAAFSIDIEMTYPGESYRGKQLSMLANPNWLADCLSRAERFRRLYASCKPLGIRADEMIQVLPDDFEFLKVAAARQ